MKRRGGSPDSDYMDLIESESGVDPSTHWYYQSKKLPLFRYFEAISAGSDAPITVVDFGSGSGFFGASLLEAYPDRIGKVLLIDIGYTDKELEIGPDPRVQKLREIPEGVGNCLLVMMDVLEHVEDEVAVLAGIQAKLSGDAHAFITVPAFMGLWSSHDVFLGHYRRYRGKQLRALLTECGYEIAASYYIFAGIFPVAWMVRRLKRYTQDMKAPTSSDMKPLPGPLNGLLGRYNGFEMRFRRFNRFFGVTCVAEGKLP